MILAIRTDKPEAELALYDAAGKLLAEERWEAHRLLSSTIHTKARELLRGENGEWADISGIVVWQGPGSFTGLRIGITVANALAYSHGVPVTGATGQSWAADGIKQLDDAPRGGFVVPDYGREAHITQPRK